MTIVPFGSAVSGLTWMMCGPVWPDVDMAWPEGAVPTGGFEADAAASGVETTISGA
jgi:hypothetical protein